jgi:hypothetical protein
MTTVIVCRPPITRCVLDPKAVKSRQQATWPSGDHDGFRMTLQVVREQLAERLDLRAEAEGLHNEGNLARREQWRDQINVLFSITAVPSKRPNEGS